MPKKSQEFVPENQILFLILIQKNHAMIRFQKAKDLKHV
jgi:hypothetical protein